MYPSKPNRDLRPVFRWEAWGTRGGFLWDLMGQANGRDTLAVTDNSIYLHSRISSLGALTIKIISAEIGERLVETFLDARVPGAP